MICINCGYCCIMYDVIIVKPEFAKPDLVIDDNNFNNVLTYKPNNTSCPHLERKNSKYFCKIHNFDWYKETPCFRHTQIEKSKDTVCRMGNRIQYDNQIKQKLKKIWRESNGLTS